MVGRVSILVTDPIDEIAVKRLKDEGFDVTVKETTQDELLKIIKNFDAIIVRSRTKVIAKVIEAGTALKVIARAGVGLDNVDTNAAKSRNITVLNSPEAPSVSVAELVFGLMLSLARGISIGDSAMKEGKWLKSTLEGFELRGKRLGIVGFGRIGKEVAKRALAFEMKVSAFDPLASSLTDAKKMGVDPVGSDREAFQQLLKTSDFVTVHVPLLPETRHMFGEKEFALMKRNAIVINTSRGGVIDESALQKTIKDGKIRGAGLDVFEEEPPKNIDLIRLANVVTTPHIGAQTVEAQEAAADIISRKVIEFFKKRGSGGR